MMIKDNNKTLIITFLVMGIICILGGSTLAYWTWQTSEADKTSVTFTTTSGFSCSANGGGNITSGQKILAPTDCTNTTYAIKRTVSTKVTNSRGTNISLDMWLNVNHMDEGLRNSDNFRYVLSTSSTSCATGVVASGTFKNIADGGKVYLLDEEEYTTSKNDTYYLYIWLDKAETSASTMNQTFDMSLGGICTDKPAAQKPNKPVLDDGMIPVKIANNGVVTAVSEDDASWYNYKNKEWANAVLVKENGIKTRTQNKVAGTTINEDDILAYYVWIPRYKYSMKTCSQIENVNENDYPECFTDEYKYQIEPSKRDSVINEIINYLLKNYEVGLEYQLSQNGDPVAIVYYENEVNKRWLDDSDKAILYPLLINMGIVDDNEVAAEYYYNVVNLNYTTAEIEEIVSIINEYNAGNPITPITPAFNFVYDDVNDEWKIEPSKRDSVINEIITSMVTDYIDSELQDYGDVVALYYYETDEEGWGLNKRWLDDSDKAILYPLLVGEGIVANNDEAAEYYYDVVNRNYDIGEIEEIVSIINEYNAENPSTPITPAFNFIYSNLKNEVVSVPQAINIEFEKPTDTKSRGTATGDSYYTHPAFTFGDQELSGIWVGKFSSSEHYEQDIVTIKPNYQSRGWGSITSYFRSSLTFAGGTLNTDTGAISFNGSSMYGLNASTNSHMMKNSEWGAIAYLSHSKYGVVRKINSNNSWVSGCGDIENVGDWIYSCGIEYGSGASEYPQSTTGNISGVFDMSSNQGAELVMTNYNNSLISADNAAYDTIGLRTLPDEKYYDLYTSMDVLEACNGGICYGQALSETAGWYNDNFNFTNLTEWGWNTNAFGRGFSGGVPRAGLFSLTPHPGYASGWDDPCFWRSIVVTR